MRGQLLGVDARTGEGLVAGQDGRRYRFVQEDWAHRSEPSIGAEVDFEATDDRARSVFPMPVAASAGQAPVMRTPPPSSDRNKLVAAALAFLLGTLGIHRFYLGRTGSGITMLVLSITVIGLAITVPWAFIDMIRYLVMSDGAFDARYPRKA